MIEAQQHLLHRGLASIRGPLVFVRNAGGVGLYDRVEVLVDDGGESRLGRIVSIADEHAVIEVFQGTEGLSLGESRLRLLSEPILLDVGPGMLGGSMMASADRSTAARKSPRTIVYASTAKRSTRYGAKCPANSSRPVFPQSMR